MGSPFWFFVGGIWTIIGLVGLIVGEGYILGREVKGWPIRLIGLIGLAVGLVMIVFGGLLDML